MKKILQSLASSILLVIAISSVNCACIWYLGQPSEPEALNRFKWIK